MHRRSTTCAFGRRSTSHSTGTGSSPACAGPTSHGRAGSSPPPTPRAWRSSSGTSPEDRRSKAFHPLTRSGGSAIARRSAFSPRALLQVHGRFAQPRAGHRGRLERRLPDGELLHRQAHLRLLRPRLLDRRLERVLRSGLRPASRPCRRAADDGSARRRPAVGPARPRGHPPSHAPAHRHAQLRRSPLDPGRQLSIQPRLGRARRPALGPVGGRWSRVAARRVARRANGLCNP